MKSPRKLVIGGALIASTLAGGALGTSFLGTASAQTADAASSVAADSTNAATPHEANGITETALTGTDAEKATAAALAAVPGATIDRVETDADGSAFEAHVTKADGTKSTVLMDSSFAVTSVEAGGPGGKGGHGGGGNGGPHEANGITETVLTGGDADKATAAALAAAPGSTIDRVETDADGGAFEAHITKADGTKATVIMDGSFAVTSVEAGRK